MLTQFGRNLCSAENAWVSTYELCKALKLNPKHKSAEVIIAKLKDLLKNNLNTGFTNRYF